MSEVMNEDNLIPLMAAIIFAGSLAGGHKPEISDAVKIADGIADAYLDLRLMQMSKELHERSSH